ncbi:SDR family oxidoreductase [Pyxidicoccus fallax]|nr:SDR family oxidoreductase [Pyxidicoccus fallax]NPC78613.1 SDR family oxidoreductase [Pyxidicoccus fallax]
MNKDTQKVALITGAGRGIGQAAALRLARDGYSVGLLARSREQLEETAAAVREAGSRAAIAVCDVRSADAVREAVHAIVSELGPVSVLVNNAGRGGGGITAKMEDDLWREVVDTNLNSIFYVTKAVLNENTGDALESIISIASTGGKQGVIYAAAYSASKHGVIGFTKSLALELAPRGITVNAVCPGFVETELGGQARRNYARLWGVDEENARKRIEQRVPMGRYIQPDEVAEMVAYLASPGAKGITGQALNICGGLGNY